MLRLLRDPDLDLVLEFLAGSAGLASGLVSSGCSALSTMLTYEWTMLRGEDTAHCSDRGMDPGPAHHKSTRAANEPSRSFTIKNLLRHYDKWALKHMISGHLSTNIITDGL